MFVTAFPDRKTMVKYLGDIAWETEVWVADDPTHLLQHPRRPCSRRLATVGAADPVLSSSA